MSRFEQYGLKNPEPKKVKPKMKIAMFGFEDHTKAAEFMVGLEAIFLNHDAEIVTMESQQIDEAMKEEIVQSVFLFHPYKNNLFNMGVDIVKNVTRPERTVFIIEEQDIEHIENQGESVDNIVLLIKGQNMSVVNTIADAKKCVVDNYNSGDELGPIAGQSVTSDQLVNAG